MSLGSKAIDCPLSLFLAKNMNTPLQGTERHKMKYLLELSLVYEQWELVTSDRCAH